MIGAWTAASAAVFTEAACVDCIPAVETLAAEGCSAKAACARVTGLLTAALAAFVCVGEMREGAAGVPVGA